MIQNVESFGMELQADALAQWEFTTQRRVYLPRSKAISRKKRQLVTDDLIEPKCVGLLALAGGELELTYSPIPLTAGSPSGP